jgi:hypothetical protein
MTMPRKLLGFCVLVCVATVAEASPIDWRVVNNFRAIVGERDQTRLLDDLHRDVKCADYRQRDSRCRRSGTSSHIRKDYATVWKGTGYNYGAKYVGQPLRRVEASVPSKSNTCRWYLDDVQLDATKCRDAEFDALLGSHVLRAVVLVNGNAAATYDQDMELKDVLIAVIGDSFASGEGVPHLPYIPKQEDSFGHTLEEVRFPTWWEERCHRSLFSPGSIAAAELAGGNPHLSVTLISFACSGADLREEGLLKPYIGRETVFQVRQIWHDLPNGIFAGRYIEPQVLSVAKALCGTAFDASTGGCPAPRRPDYVIITVGGNDLGFGEVVRDLIGKCDSECLNRNAHFIRQRLKALDGNLSRLAEKIAGWSPQKVLLTEYMDPAQRALDKSRFEFCSDKAFGSRTVTFDIGPLFGYAINKTESEFAHTKFLIPLNSDLRDFAA